MRRAARTHRQPVRAETVTYVPGMNCDLCVRNGPNRNGGPNGIRTGVSVMNHAFAKWDDHLQSNRAVEVHLTETRSRKFHEARYVAYSN